MNRKQIIAITVLGIAALMLGCKPNATGIGEVAGNHRELTLEEKKIVGTYERTSGKNIHKSVFLENGTMMVSINGKPSLDGKWNITDKEVHVKWREYERVLIYKINPDGSLTDIASIDNKGKRTAISKKIQFTSKKNKIARYPMKPRVPPKWAVL